MELVQQFFQQVGLLRHLWMPFSLALVIVGIVIWKFAGHHHSGAIATLEHRLRLKDDMIEYERNKNAHQHDVPLSAPRGDMEPFAPVIMQSAVIMGPREFVPENVTFASLMALRSKSSGIAGDKLVASYIGKWIKVEGDLFESELLPQSALLSILPGKLGQPHISLYFARETDGLEVIGRGDMVTAIGRITHIASTGLVMVDCELIF
jgi:hypothetical protein